MLGWQEQNTRAGESQQPTVIKESVIYLWPKYVNRHVYDKTNSYPRLHSVPHTIFSFFFLRWHCIQINGGEKKIPVILSFLRWGFFFPGGNYCNFFFNKKNPGVFSPNTSNKRPGNMDPAFVFGGSIGEDICVSSHLFHVCFWTCENNRPAKYKGKIPA